MLCHVINSLTSFSGIILIASMPGWYTIDLIAPKLCKVIYQSIKLIGLQYNDRTYIKFNSWDQPKSRIPRQFKLLNSQLYKR